MRCWQFDVLISLYTWGCHADDLSLEVVCRPCNTPCAKRLDGYTRDRSPTLHVQPSLHDSKFQWLAPKAMAASALPNVCTRCCRDGGLANDNGEHAKCRSSHPSENRWPRQPIRLQGRCLGVRIEQHNWRLDLKWTACASSSQICCMLLRPLASHIKVQYLHRGRNKSSIRAISYRLQDRNMETLVKALGETGQTHVLDGWDRLDADQRVQLSKDVEVC